MIGNTSTETHFRYASQFSPPPPPCGLPSLTPAHPHPSPRLVIISEAFRSKMQPARHRMIYALLRDEMSQDNGIHALQLRTLTPEEAERQKKKAEEAQQQKQEDEGEATTCSP